MQSKLPEEITARIDLEARQFAFYNYVTQLLHPNAVFENMDTWPGDARVCYYSILHYMSRPDICWPYKEPTLATEGAQWKVKYDELKEKYDNILATEDGHLSQTENVWQSGFAAGHDAGYEKANHKVRNELQKQFIENDVKWVKENQQLKERAEKYENTAQFLTVKCDELGVKNHELKERCDKMEAALEAIKYKSLAVGQPGCTWGDTNHDSMSVAAGFNVAITECSRIATKALFCTDGHIPGKGATLHEGIEKEGEDGDS